jgi:dienelactone hydrolase
MLPHLARLPLIWLMIWLTVAWFMTASALATDLGLPGPFPAGQRSVTVTRANGSTFTAQLIYPATAAGANQPFHPQAGPAPAISFGHGFLQTTSRYLSTLQHLASHGFIVIASDSETSLFPSHANFASDLSRCLTYLEQQNDAPGAFLAGRVDTAAFGISGHSMGGGASLLAAGTDLRIRAIAVEAPAETNPSAIAASASLAAPALLIVGDADTIVPTGSHGQLMYNAIRTPRQLANIRGGYHCGFIDSTGIGCDSSSLARADQLLTTRRLLTSWFSLYLKESPSPWRAVWGPDAPVDARVTQTADPRMTLTPRRSSDIMPAGGAARFDVQLRNTDESPVDVDFVVEGAAGGWNATLTPANARVLAAGGAMTVSLDVVAAASGTAELFVVVRNVADGGTIVWASVSLTVACPADFNLDGGVDGSDIEAFFATWTKGDSTADVNADGGIDGGDVETFFQRWEAGGC